MAGALERMDGLDGVLKAGRCSRAQSHPDRRGEQPCRQPNGKGTPVDIVKFLSPTLGRLRSLGGGPELPTFVLLPPKTSPLSQVPTYEFIVGAAG